MIKKRQSQKPNKKLIISAVVVVGFLVISAVLLSLPNPFAEVSVERSVMNRALMQEASSKTDASICDQIVGGVREIKSEPGGHDGDVVYEASFGSPKLSESEAKEQCRKNVERSIEHQKQLREESSQ